MCVFCENTQKNWNGGDRNCAFKDGENFTSDNWMCAAMNFLRYSVESVSYDDETEQSCGIINVGSGNFVVIYWYKSRGRTENAMLISNRENRIVRLSDFSHLIKS